MAARKKREYTCTAIYTEGCEQRLTQALVDIYYNRINGISSGGTIVLPVEKSTEKGPE